MHEFSPLLSIVSFAYLAAGAGLVAALLGMTWARRGRRRLSAGEAAWCAFLPALALLMAPIALVLPHPAGFLDAMHRQWHGWEQTLHGAPVTHALLHAANYGMLVLASAGMIRLAYALARTRAFVSSVRSSAQATGHEVEGIPLYTIRTIRPLCFTMGIRSPAIYLSTGLQDQLSPSDRQAMLLHEAAHVRRKDSAVRTFFYLFYALFPLPGARLLLRAWREAVERECDAEAAHRVGSSAQVAAALIRAAQALLRPAAALPDAACFAVEGDDIEGRVQALLDGRDRTAIRPAILVLFGLGFVLASGAWVSHAVELFVSH